MSNGTGSFRRAAAVLGVGLALAACGSAGGSGGASATAPSVDSSLRPVGPTIEHVRVDRVVDGDTIRVLLDGRTTSVRLIGINTPETVKPDSPVECFGPEASDFAKSLLGDAAVTLEFDDSQGRLDQYDRTLAYVWRELPDGSLRLFNLEAVAGGYAEERQYGSVPYAWSPILSAAEDAARGSGVGLWGACRQS